MSRIYNDITELVGGTPLVRLSRYSKAQGLPVEFVAEVERQNPAGSA